MTTDYRKWDFLDDVSSEEDENREKLADIRRLRSLSKQNGPSATLVTIPWDTHCECVRWVLDRHGVPYVEDSLPWGLHLWRTLGYEEDLSKKQVTEIPIFETDKGEIFKRSPIDIYTYLFSRSLSGSIRLYGHRSALDLQARYDAILAPAAKAILLHTTLSNRHLVDKIMFETIHLKTWNTINILFWPILSILMRRLYDVNDDTTEEAWAAVMEVYSDTSVLLEQKSKSGTRHPFLCGNDLTIADITFAAHSIPILCCSEEDLFASHLQMRVPALNDLPENVRRRVVQLRETTAGKHALRMYRKERGTSYRSLRSRYSREANPWWADVNILRGMLAFPVGLCLLSIYTLVRLAGPLYGFLTFIGAAAGCVFGVAQLLQDTVFARRMKQLWIVATAPSDQQAATSAKVEPAHD
ncbi:hypothetical protein HDU85_000349 [Gaertneriomyces sp. JEL0708]|nr:hypothetical protein HDU85_000349 [Gaertneriomyces sp. JEL0708]